MATSLYIFSGTIIDRPVPLRVVRDSMKTQKQRIGEQTRLKCEGGGSLHKQTKQKEIAKKKKYQKKTKTKTWLKYITERGTRI